MKTAQKRRHYLDTNVAGFTYLDGPIVFESLHTGSQLRLVRKEDNPFDPYAISLCYGGNKIGFVPRRENKDLCKFLDQGWSKLFDVRINRITPTSLPEDQIGIVIYIKLNPNMEE